jgi:hypothetical protein
MSILLISGLTVADAMTATPLASPTYPARSQAFVSMRTGAARPTCHRAVASRRTG